MRKKALSAVVIISFVILAIFPQSSQNAVKDGMILCVSSVIPSLFSFGVLSKIAYRTGASDTLALLFRPISKFLKLTDEEAGCIIMGSICGFPIGASLTADIAEKRNLSEKDARHLAVMSNNVSAGFMIVFVGRTLYGSTKLGVILYLTQIISGLCVCFFTGNKDKINFNEKNNADCNDLSFSDVVTSSVTESAMSCLAVTAFICAFSVLNAYIAKIAEAAGFNQLVKSIISSLTELSSGCVKLSELPHTVSLPLISFFVSFSGICVLCQSSSFLARAGVSMKKYVFMKLIQGLLSSAFTFVFSMLFDIETNVSNACFVELSTSKVPENVSVLISAVFFILTFKSLFRKYE